MSKDSEITSLKQRITELESLHPGLKKEPVPLYKVILKWALFLLITGVILYSIYLFYCYDQLGKDIVIPFYGVLKR